MEYYNNVSMSIDDDKYFEVMMNSAWNLDKSKVTKKGWGGEVWTIHNFIKHFFFYKQANLFKI